MTTQPQGGPLKKGRIGRSPEGETVGGAEPAADITMEPVSVPALVSLIKANASQFAAERLTSGGEQGGIAPTIVTAITPSRRSENTLTGPQLVEAFLEAKEKERLLGFTESSKSLEDPDSVLSRAKLAREAAVGALVVKVRSALEGVQTLGKELIANSSPTITGATLNGERVNTVAELAGKPGVKEITNIYVLGDNEGVDGNPEAVVRMQMTIGGKKLDGTQGSDIEVTRTSLTLFAEDEVGALVGTELLDSGNQRLVVVGGYSGVGFKDIRSLESKIPWPDESISIKGSRIVDPSEAIKPDGEGVYDYSFEMITGDTYVAGVALETATIFDGSYFADFLGGILLGHPTENGVSASAILGVRPPEVAEAAVSESVVPSVDGEAPYFPDPRRSTLPDSLGEALVDAISYFGSSRSKEEVIAGLQALDSKRISAIALKTLTGRTIPETADLTSFELEISRAALWCSKMGMLQHETAMSRGLEFAQTLTVVRDQYLRGALQL